jgi:hypothetical protein
MMKIILRQLQIISVIALLALLQIVPSCKTNKETSNDRFPFEEDTYGPALKFGFNF